MELGATVCLPRNPLCLVCPLSVPCRARAGGVASQLPVKLRKVDPVRLAGVLLVIRKGNRVLLRQREAAASRMAGFWDLPTPEDLPGARPGAELGRIRHTITHHHYTLAVVRATPPARVAGPFHWIDVERLQTIPLSTSARKAMALDSPLFTSCYSLVKPRH